jgi:hypothetical protein
MANQLPRSRLVRFLPKNTGIVREMALGSLHVGGTLDADTASDVISRFKDQGDLLIGLWPDDDLWERLPSNSDDVGSVLEFSQRSPDETVSLMSETLPEGCQSRDLDSDLFKHSMMGKYFTEVFGSARQALEQAVGLCLTRGKGVSSEGSAGPSANGLIEIGVETKQQYQHHGNSTWVCARLVRECEGPSYRTYWNCDARNKASIALAGKLGYQPENEHRLAPRFW